MRDLGVSAHERSPEKREQFPSRAPGISPSRTNVSRLHFSAVGTRSMIIVADDLTPAHEWRRWSGSLQAPPAPLLSPACS